MASNIEYLKGNFSESAVITANSRFVQTTAKLHHFNAIVMRSGGDYNPFGKVYNPVNRFQLLYELFY